MTTQREALQQALKALEIAKKYLVEYDVIYGNLLAEYDEMTDAITAIRAALAEPVVNQSLTTEPVQEPGDFNSLNPRDCWMKGYMTGVRAALDWEEYLKKLGELR